MSSPKPRPKAKKPSWFQDTKSGCEKQTDYFLKIRKLQKELINREQHNLVNAMERLKQLQYPRRRPIVRNFPPSEKGASTAFPRRSFRSLPGQKHVDKDKLIKPLKGKHLLPDRATSIEDQALDALSLEDIKYLYNRMLPVMNDQQIAKITSEVRSTFPNEPSTYLLQPHLPSIPNVKRKATTRLANRLKLLTLSEESQYRTLSVPKIATSLSLHKKRVQHGPPLHEMDEEKKAKKKEQRNILYFDVDPNDSSVFAHAAYDKHLDDDAEFDDGGGNHENAPLPPPNSRPNSLIARKNPEIDQETDHEESCNVSLDASQADLEKVEQPATEKAPSSAAEETKEGSMKENDGKTDINDEQVSVHEKIESNVDDTANEEKMTESKQLTENALKDDTDDNQEINDNHLSTADRDDNQELNDNQLSDINIAEPKVIIKTNKHTTENTDE